MKIFIGSSKESIQRLREIELWLEEDGHEPIAWDTPGLFPPGENTFMSLINISQDVDAAIFIFSEDDKIWYRGDPRLQPRDNILIEYGLFTGTLGSRKSIICRYGTPKNASDLEGITVINMRENQNARSRKELHLWANSLTSSPNTPTLEKLFGKIHELELQVEDLKEKITFEQAKSEDLENILQEEEYIDFSSIDLAQDGYWKLLFNYSFFKGATGLLSKYGKTPEDIHNLLISCEADNVARQITWQIDETNPQKNIIMARKVLHVFRRFCSKQDFSDFINNSPQKLKKNFTNLAQSVLKKDSKYKHKSYI